jgi:Adenine deaminase
VTRLPYGRPEGIPHLFCSAVPDEKALRLHGTGTARVIGLEEGQILTRAERVEVEGDRMPDPDRDLLSLLVCSRYRPGVFSTGLVRGLGFEEGALASSVSHDAHNVVAVGADPRSLRLAAEAVISRNGGMAVVSREGTCVLPLDCAGLMSSASYEAVVEDLVRMDDRVRRMGGIPHAFMYLSFLTLSVIPELRMTERGLYDAISRRLVPLFIS